MIAWSTSLQGRLARRLGLLFLIVFVAATGMLFFRYRGGHGDIPTERQFQFVRQVARALVAGPDGQLHVDLPPDHEPFEFVVRNVDGTVLLASPSDAAARLGPVPAEWGRGLFEFRPLTGPATATGAFERVTTPSGPVIVQVAEAESRNVRQARSVAEELAEDVAPIMLPLVLAALIIGIFTIRDSLAPLATVAREAAAITPSETHRRLTEGGLPDELQPLVAAINGALDRLDEGFRRQREFTADAAHELRTPLAILAAHLDSFGNGGASASLREDVARMTRLVSQLLSVAQLEALAVAPDEVADLHALAVDVAGSMAPLALRQGKEIAVVGAETPVRVHGNGESLRQAIRNLVENAAQHTPAGTAVEIEVSAAPAISVRDHGRGVPVQLRDRVTQRFWRADRRKGEGAGLGLAIVKRIADAHGGTLDIDDAPGGGARFTLRLPPGVVA